MRYPNIGKYFHVSTNTLLIGVKAGILAMFLGVIQVLLQPTSLIIICGMFGIFVASIIETIGHNLDRVIRLRYCLFLSVCTGITFGLGVYTSGHYFITVILITIFMIIYGYSNTQYTIMSNIILFTGNLFVIGNGIPAPNWQLSIGYGLGFLLGSSSMFALEYIVFFYKIRREPLEYKFNSNNCLFNFSRKTTIFAFLYTTTVIFAYTISYSLKLEQGFWVPMTTLLIFKSCYDLSWQRVAHRFTGSLLGFIVALSIGVYISNLWVLLSLIFILYCLIVVSLAKHYGAYAFFLTIMITTLYKLINFNGASLTQHRLIDTVIGVSIVAIVLVIRKILIQLISELCVAFVSAEHGKRILNQS
jgi:hypothetical protein